MSFLNPVNEPVKRFSSSDAGAPQINYNARVAGDVKAVLKACLVTGYGAKASAGWTAENEVNHVAEFVSPSVAMSDYRLGIDDTSASSTTWYHQYLGARKELVGGTPKKVISSIDRSNAKNGWQLLVTERGIIYLEIVYQAAINDVVTRLTYWGQTKLAIADSGSENICFWNIGVGSHVPYTNHFFEPVLSASSAYYRVNSYSTLSFSAVNISLLRKDFSPHNSLVALSGDLFLTSGLTVVAKQPAIILNHVNDYLDLFGVNDVLVSDRPMINVCLGQESSDKRYVEWCSCSVLIPIDYWEY